MHHQNNRAYNSTIKPHDISQSQEMNKIKRGVESRMILNHLK